jgi:hypothetical protein
MHELNPIELAVERFITETISPLGMVICRDQSFTNGAQWHICHVVKDRLKIDSQCCTQIRCYNEPAFMRELPYNFAVIKASTLHGKRSTQVNITYITLIGEVVTFTRPMPYGWRTWTHELPDPRSLPRLQRQLKRLKELTERIDAARYPMYMVLAHQEAFENSGYRG